MWACRSFLSRPRTLLNSIRRRATEPPPVSLGAASRWLVSDAIDGKRPYDAKDTAAVTSARCNGGGESDTSGTSRKSPAPAANRSPPAATGEKKHLYLVLDDAKYGFGIHKLDIAAAAADPNADVASDEGVEFNALPCLPTPPVVRIEERWVYTFAVLGSNVIGLGSGLKWSRYDDRSDGDTLTFDTRTSQLALLPDLPNGLRNGLVRLAVAVGSRRVYVIEDTTQYHGNDYNNKFCFGGLHCLRLAEDGSDDDDDDTDDGRGNGDEGVKKPRSKPAEDDNPRYWHRHNFNNYKSTRWYWSEDPLMLPLSPEGITAHAVDPSGRAFFVSVHDHYIGDHRGRGTFSYDIEHRFWRRHGDWKLPFIGKAHYHAGLHAWVGLHVQRDGHGRLFVPDGHICTCKVPQPNSVAAPKWKLGKERLFVQDPRQRVDAKLVDMGGGGRFCLVEIKMEEGVDDRKGGADGDGEKCVLRLTTFGVECDDDGELLIVDRRPAGSFKTIKYYDFSHIYSDCWQAFWA